MALPPAIDCWYLTGQTASGKTGVGIELARLLNAEIISLDSMAIYRDMNVGTAKPTAAQLRMVPHHLINIVSPDLEFSLAQYVEAAHDAIADIRSRGKQPLFVGGTPLYLKGMLRGVFEGPPADWSIRNRLQEEVESHGSACLHQRLEEVDPDSARRLHPNDSRRIIRALEVLETTGRTISEQQREFEKPQGTGPFHVFVLNWPRDVIYDRINRRVDDMIDEGLVDEVRSLLDKYQPLGRTARQAVGYREVIDYLEGRTELDHAIEQIKAHTRQFAKRQATWFRSLEECTLVDLVEPFDALETARRLY